MNRFGNEQSNVDARIEKLMSAAIDLCGSEKEAAAFLNRPHAALDNQSPVTVAEVSRGGFEKAMSLIRGQRARGI